MRRVLITAGLVSLLSQTLWAQSTLTPTAPADSTPGTGWEIGTRITHYTFRDDTKGTKFNGSFLGSLTKIKDDQNYAPVKVFAQYFFSPVWGAGISYEEIDAITWDGGTDGTVELAGPVVYLTGRLPDYDLVRPYAELGLAYFSASFDHNPAWYDGGRHVMEVDDSLGLSLGVGADVLLSDVWSLNFLLRYTEASVDATAIIRDGADVDGTFVMDHFTFGLGAKYVF